MKNYWILFFACFTVSTLTAQETPPRPQEPKKPYPYIVEEVAFRNESASITLSGTLTLPKGKTDFPVVVLISGSSPHNRNQEVAGHKTFLVVSDYLTRNGIGVLRYDDRGVGQSEGKYEIAAYADRTSDVESAVAYLKTRKDINPNRIGLVGHSEGGLIAPRVAAKPAVVSFIVMMGAPALPGKEIILLQTALKNKHNGASESQAKVESDFLASIFDAVIASNDLESTRSGLSEGFKTHPERLPAGMKAGDVEKMLSTFTAPWFQNILKYDPGKPLAQVKCPVLAINGEKDWQIPPKENLGAIRRALEKGGNKQATVKELPGLNHMFQEAQTGSVEEFATITQTFSPMALHEIMVWVKGK